MHRAVEPLDQPVGDLAIEPAQNAVAMTLDGVSSVDHRLQPAVGGLEVPSLKIAGARLGRGLIIEFLKGQPDLLTGR